MLIEAVDESGRGMSDEDLRDQLVTLLIGGHETTATTLAWTVALSLEYPHVHDAICSEYERVFGDAAWDAAKVPQLEYAGAVAKETLRLYPVSAAVGRRLQAPWKVGGYCLPEGIIVAPSTFLIQRDPRIWRDPLRFEPERFLAGKPSRTEWMPFGGGTRTCLGMAFALYEIKVVLPMLLRRVKLARVAPLPGLGARGFLLGPRKPLRARVAAVES
jgi:hypothetical protein